jgi:hypothetical protein
MRLHLVCLILTACGSTVAVNNTSDAGVDAPLRPRLATSDLPCEVDGILGRACHSCHGNTPTFGAPMPLDRRADLLAPAPSDPSKKVWQTVKDRVHLAPDAPGRMPQKPNLPLTDAERAALDKYFADGLPASSCTSSGADPKAPTVSCTPDVSVRGSSPWSMPKTTRDEYVCYGFEYKPDLKRHITGLLPKIQNPKIVHHILLMQADGPVPTKPYKCDEFSIARYRMLYAWAPGVGGYELPEAAGLPSDPAGTHYVVQTHYNNTLSLDGQTDDSGFDLCTTDKLRPNDADILAFGSAKFAIPEKGRLDITARWVVPVGFTDIFAFGAFPHMHQLGTYISTSVHPKGTGTAIDMGTDPRFDFASQFFAPLPNVKLSPGDVVETRCIWENPTDRAVTWGENTDDEMCFSFTLYYPKVATKPWSWGSPAFLSNTEVNE